MAVPAIVGRVVAEMVMNALNDAISRRGDYSDKTSGKSEKHHGSGGFNGLMTLGKKSKEEDSFREPNRAVIEVKLSPKHVGDFNPKRPANAPALAKGGEIKKRRDGIALKGKTRGRHI